MKLSVIVPVYNEETNIAPAIEAVDGEFRGADDVELEFVFVDDGSRDGTFGVLQKLAVSDSRIRVVRFTRNFGSHAALLAGLEHCSGDAAAYLPADLQDPPSLLREMLGQWRKGFPVVWGQRRRRDDAPADSFFSLLYYRIMRRFALPDMPSQGLDTFLVGRDVITPIVNMREKNTAIFGLILWCGFPQTIVCYDRIARVRGGSGWTFGKKIKLVADSLVAFSHFPIRLVTYLGILFASAGFAFGIFTVVRVWMGGASLQGWPSLVTIVVGLSGLQLLMLGIISEYLWRSFDEVRRRPPYVVRGRLGFDREVGKKL